MGRKPSEKWSLSGVVELFNELPPRDGGRRMTHREFYRVLNASRAPERFQALLTQMLFPAEGVTCRFETQVDPEDKQRVWIVMVDRGY